MNAEKISAYLVRIGWSGPVDPTLATLAALHETHLLTTPFENLDISLKREIVLDLDRLHEKIVSGRRGGFCYELNGLLGSLLKGLGFDLDMVAARVANDNGVLGPEFDHMALVVRVGGKRLLADVGFGDSFRRPIDLDDPSPQSAGDPLGRAWSVRSDDGVLALVQHEVDGASRATYAFTLEPRALADYAPMCVYQQTSPDSHFTTRRICSRATTEGRISLTDDRLIVTTRRERVERPVAETERAQILLREFGVRMN